MLVRSGLLFAQTSFLAGDSIAVFYPAGFDSVKTLPSFAIDKQLTSKGRIPGNWKLFPVFSQENGKAVVDIRYNGNADLYGNGEVTGSLRRNETEVTLWNTDNYGYGKENGKQLYQSHPWVMGVRADGTAFGIIADNTWKQSFHLANPIKISSEGPSFRVIIVESSNPAQLLKKLAWLTGTIELPPLWALGYQQCRYSYYPDKKVMEIAHELRNRKIPADGIWMDIDYMQDYKIFTFDSVKFPHPALLNDSLHMMGFKSVFMIDPGVKKEPGYFVYDEGSKGSHWVLNNKRQEFNGKVWPGICAFPDFTKPETQQWWKTLYKDFMRTGIDGVWNDMNEPSVFDGPGGSMPDDNIHRGGGSLPEGTHLRYHDVYGMLMVKASREGILDANPEKRPFVLSRASYLGGQKYAATWTGDNISSWKHLKMATPMVLNMGLSGQPFSGPDIGGFGGSADAHLFANWISIGAFYPFCRNHSSKSSAAQEPWMFGEKVEDISRRAINLRYRLLPYLYTLFREASITGMPVMRPVFFADFKDTSLRKEEDAFLWGSNLLIIPNWSKNPSLPKGVWRNFDIGNYTIPGDTIQPKILMRGGSIIPVTAGIIQNTSAYKTDSLTLLVCLDNQQKAKGQVYIDKGEGFGYKQGVFELLQFEATQKGKNQVSVQCRHVEGRLNNKNRVFRIGIVSDKGIAYGKWQKNQTISILTTR